MTAAQQKRDEQACLQASVGTPGPGPSDFGAVIDREAFNECLARRGHSARFMGR